MNNLMGLMDPVGKEYCDYFYYLGILGLILMVSSVLMFFINFFREKDNDKMRHVSVLIHQLVIAFGMYFVNRILYTMCAKFL